MEQLRDAFFRLKCLKQEAQSRGLSWRLVPSLSRTFAPSVISDVECSEDTMTVTVSMMSLYGNNAVLPDYFTDEILRDQQSGLRMFLDMFVHRQLETQFEIWSKHQFFAENTLDAEKDVNRQMDQVVLALGGSGRLDSDAEELFTRGLKRCLVGLFQRRIKTPMGLRFLLKSFFGPIQIQIDQHTVTYRPVPETQRSALGRSTAQLGVKGNFIAGSRMVDTDGGFSLTMDQLDLETFYHFLPGGEGHADLIELLQAYTGGMWDCDLNLVLKSEEIPEWELGSMRLGSDTWALGEPAFEDAFVPIGRIGGNA